MYNNIQIEQNGTATVQNAREHEQFLTAIRQDITQITKEFLTVAPLKPGQILVVGCSSSEVTGNKIGKASIPSIAEAILDGMLPLLEQNGIFLAAQCCEHLNRALIISAKCAAQYNLEEVCVRPMPKAGGSFASAFYNRLSDPVAVEHIRAHAGFDIGGTLIGMHLREVAVPVRLSLKKVGEADFLCAKTRPKYIGGPRAVYETV